MGMEQEKLTLSNSPKYPRLMKCVLCTAYKLEKDLITVEVPDQAGWVEKKACQECLDEILKAEGTEK